MEGEHFGGPAQKGQGRAMSREIRWGVLSTGSIARNSVRTAAAIPVFGAICGTEGRIEIPEFTNPQRATLFVDSEACASHRSSPSP